MKNELKIKIALDNQTKEIKLIRDDFSKLSDSINKSSSSTQKFQDRMKFMGHIAGGVYTVQQAFQFLNSTIGKVAKTGYAFNNSMEQSIAGLQALSVATSSNISSTGEILSLTQKYSLAQKEATKTAKELAKINTETPHTLDQTNQIYKAMYVSMKNVGASTEQMINLTKKISIAAGSAGIEFNSLLAGVDGLATGTVLANSDLGRFLSGLGLTNDKLKESDNVIELLGDRLSEFKALDTMEIATSNLANSWSQLAGTLTEDIFENSKSWTNSLADSLSSVNKKLIDYKNNIENAQDVHKQNDLNVLKEELKELEVDLIKAERATTKIWNKLGTDDEAKVLKIEMLIKTVKNKIKSLEEESKTGLTNSIDTTEIDKLVNTTLYPYETGLISINEKWQKHYDFLVKNGKDTSGVINAWTVELDGYNLKLDETPKKLKSIASTTSTSSLISYYEAIGDYQTAWLIKEGQLKEQYVSLTDEQFKAMYQIAKTEYFDKINDEKLTVMFSDYNSMGFEQEFETMAKLIEENQKTLQSFNDFSFDIDTAGLDKVGKSLYTIKDIFGELGKENDLYNKALLAAGDDQEKLNKVKQGHLTNEIDGYANIASAAAGMFEENSKGYEALIKVQQVLQIVNQARALSEMFAGQAAVASATMSATAKQGEMVAGAGASVASAGTGDPYTAPARVAAMLALMASVMSMFGGGASGGASTSSPYSTSEMATQAIMDAEQQTVLNKLDQQIDLLEAIEKNGSAAALSVKLAEAQFNQDKSEWVQDIFNESRMGFRKSGFGDDSWNYISDYYASKELLNPYLWQSGGEQRDGNIAINSELLRSNPDELIKIVADMATFTRGDGYSYTGPFFQEMASDVGWDEEGHEAFLAAIKESFTEIQGSLNDWAISVVETVADMQGAADDMKSFYDDITGTTYYADKELADAYEDFNRILDQSQYSSYESYLVGNINAIENAADYMYRFSGVSEELADGTMKQLSNYELLLSKNGDYIVQQMETVKLFGDEVGVVFSGGVDEAMNYLDAIERVSEAMANSRENIKDFIDGLKTDRQLAEDIADQLGVGLATSINGLAQLFADLATDGLTDLELSLLEANKELLDTSETTRTTTSNADELRNSLDRLNDQLKEAQNATSIFENVVNSITEMINVLRGSVGVTEDYDSIVVLLRDAISKNDAELAQQYVKELQSVYQLDSNSYGFAGQYAFEKLQRAEELEALKTMAESMVITNESAANNYESQIKSAEVRIEEIEIVSNSIDDLNSSLAAAIDRLGITITNGIIGTSIDTNQPTVSESMQLTQNATNGTITREQLVRQFYIKGLGAVHEDGVDYWTNTSTTSLSDLYLTMKAAAIGNGQQWNEFASGGYTGNIPINQVAGLVHGQEFVVDAKTTKNLGLNQNSGGVFKEILGELKQLRSTTQNQEQRIARMQADNNKMRKILEREEITRSATA